MTSPLAFGASIHYTTPDLRQKVCEILKHRIQPNTDKKNGRPGMELWSNIGFGSTEHSTDFIKAKHQHSAVESAINALEVHGLDRCPDHGLNGFKRYVALAVLARNIQQLGVRVREKQLALIKRQEKVKKAAYLLYFCRITLWQWERSV